MITNPKNKNQTSATPTPIRTLLMTVAIAGILFPPTTFAASNDQADVKAAVAQFYVALNAVLAGNAGPMEACMDFAMSRRNCDMLGGWTMCRSFVRGHVLLGRFSRSLAGPRVWFTGSIVELQPAPTGRPSKSPDTALSGRLENPKGPL